MQFHNFQRPVLLIYLTVMLWSGPLGIVLGGSGLANAMGEGSEQVDSPKRILDAARSVDEAWEEFHRSAIEGTLASPEIQTQIEQQLHDARGLLMNARKANRKGDHRSVVNITDQVIALSKIIIESSREKKQ
ncbi:hypothetical protein [Candidatus Nitrospira salsa]